jgi:hypothetical protein
VIFDSSPDSGLPFEDRLALAKSKIDALQAQLPQTAIRNANVKVVPMERCTGYEHLHSKLFSILEQVCLKG